MNLHRLISLNIKNEKFKCKKLYVNKFNSYAMLQSADTAKTFQALPDRKSIFYNFFPILNMVI